MVREGQGLFRCKGRNGEILMSAMERHREDGARFFLEMHCSRDNGYDVE